MFFLGAWVLYTTYAVCMRAYAVWEVAYASFLAKQAACSSAYANFPTPINQQVPMRRAYTAYAALQKHTWSDYTTY